jgi:ketosteroid isomerase-like protein
VTAADQSSVALEAELSETIDSFDRAFSEGGLDEFLAGFADDAQLLIHQQETVTGKEAIRASFGQVFDQFDTSAYQPRYEIIDVRGNRAYVLVSFDEVLRQETGSLASAFADEPSTSGGGKTVRGES